MKVLHLPTLVGGMAWGLAQGERRLGLDSRVLTTSSNWLDYPYDISLNWERKGTIATLLSSLRAFGKYRKQFDVFHFNFGSTLIDFRRLGIYHWDLPFYPKNKRIIFTYNGCDARQKYKTMERTEIAACHEEECYEGICNNGSRDRMREKRIRIAAKYAHHLFAVNPDLLHFLPEPCSSFLPYSISSWYEIKALPYQINRRIKILHSPTNRAAKGSGFIIQALKNLEKKYPIEILIIENLPHQKALEAYQTADVIIDQTLAGWYGGLAVEGMKMGKPVCVFIREEDLPVISGEMAKDLHEAVIHITPFTIEEALGAYLQNPHLLHQKRQAGLDYVHRWHDPVYVAGITKSIYES